MDSLTSEANIIVPYRWSRLVSESQGQDQQGNLKPATVYYTSPSGRVLLSRKDVRRYLREVHSCKCYIDSSILEDQNGVATIAKSFNFDPSIGCYMVPPPSIVGAPGHSSPCLSWAAQFPANVITRELESLARKLRRQLMHSPDDVHWTLFDNDKENNDGGINRDWCFKKWLTRINWDEVVISNNGHIYLTNLYVTQMKHLLYECVKEGMVESPVVGVGLNLPPQVEPKTIGAKVNKVKVQEKPCTPTPPPIASSPPQQMSMVSPPSEVSASVKGRGRPKGSGAKSPRRRRKSIDYQPISATAADYCDGPEMVNNVVLPPEDYDHYHHQQEVDNYASSVVSSTATELTENGGHKVYYEIEPVVRSGQGTVKSTIRKETRSIFPVARSLNTRPSSTPVRSVSLESQAIQDFKQAMENAIHSESKVPVTMVPLDLSPKVKPESSKASKSKVCESIVQESKVPLRRTSLPKIVEAPRTLAQKTAEPEVDVKKAAHRERRNSKSRIKRATETPEEREVRLDKKREYNKRYRLKRRLSQMQEEEDLAKMQVEEEDQEVGGGDSDNEDDTREVAKPKKIKVWFADEVVGADPFENPYSLY